MTWLDVLDRPVTARTAARRTGIDFTFMYLAVLGASLFVAAFAWKRAWQPYIGLASAVLLLTWLAWAVRPLLGLKLTLFLSLVGDTATITWFPFNKNLSSHESIFWIANGISFSPLELTLVVALLSVGGRRWLQSRRLFVWGGLAKPLSVLVATICFGYVYGIGRGGDFRVAVFEGRALLYFPIIYLLTTTLCTQVRHFRHLFYAALAAITVQSILSTEYALGISAARRSALESLTEHGSSIGMNLLFVTCIATLAIRGCPWRVRVPLMFATAATAWVYLLSQRRVAFVAFVLALILFFVILFWRQRRTFWLIVPVVAFIGVGYVGAFWNSDSAAGFPAQAVKTVIAPGDLSAKDQSSDQYRIIENFNLRATIRSSPVTGLGFGRPFLRPIPLPDISGFEFNAYIPHNSLLWIWIKLGIVGFIAFLYTIARAIAAGVDRVRRQAIGMDLVVSIGALLFSIMFAVYLFADIAWEPRNSMLFGVCLAMCASSVGIDRDEGDIDVDADRAEALLSASDDPRGATRVAELVGNQ